MTPYKRRILSFKYALEGLSAAFKEEPNFKIHTVVTILIITAGFYFNITKVDWILVIFLIGLVIALELTNTAIEAVIDSFTEDQHPKAKYAKDISAGAVLVVSISAATIGLIIFLPYVSNFW